MKLERAIELNNISKEGFPVGDDVEDYYLAIKLGIEALKRLKLEKDEIPDSLWNYLPGETKD